MKCAPFCDDSANGTPLFARFRPEPLVRATRRRASRRRRLELVEAAAVDRPGDDPGRRPAPGTSPGSSRGSAGSTAGASGAATSRGAAGTPAREVTDDGTRDRERVLVARRVVVGDSDCRCARRRLGSQVTSGRSRPSPAAGAMKIVPVPRTITVVRHGRHVRAAGGARAHHHRDLCDPLRRHSRLVEDPSEMVAIGKDLGLERQEGPRVDEVDARAVLLGVS